MFENPYADLEAVRRYACMLKEKYNLSIPSMQSIWYGVTKSIFGTDEDRAYLIDYTKRAVDFACAAGCKNMVFGCPKNRNLPDGAHAEEAYDFFRAIGDYAAAYDTVIALEPNPPIYNTNFINTTAQALAFVQAVNSDGLRINLDIGTMIYNDERFSSIAPHAGWINHIHLSEPNLVRIEKRAFHEEIHMLDYDRYLSIEMRNLDDINAVKAALQYAGELIA